MTFVLLTASSLALLAATMCFALLLREKKRNKERSAAVMRYVDTVSKGAANALEKRIADLEKGIVPDFEKAKAAANAVNDFNAGISGILGFDPHEVLKKQRQEGGETL